MLSNNGLVESHSEVPHASRKRKWVDDESEFDGSQADKGLEGHRPTKRQKPCKSAVENQMYTALELACLHGWTDQVQNELNTSEPRKEQLEYSFQLACYGGHLHLVQLLLNQTWLDPSANDNEALKFAAAQGHGDIVDLLLADYRLHTSMDHTLSYLGECRCAYQHAMHAGHTAVASQLLMDPLDRFYVHDMPARAILAALDMLPPSLVVHHILESHLYGII
jgi:hypothetical protein